jgi:glycosyltransferase involved in cell wall biosynthesis
VYSSEPADRLPLELVRTPETSDQRMLGTFSVSVVIPTLNEAANLRHVLPKIPTWIDEIVIVDGHSTDGTPEVAKEICPKARIVMQSGKGKGNALRAGFEAATGDIIVMLDADGSTDPAEIPMFIGPLLAGADFVKGSRFLQGGGTADMTPFRKAGNWVLTKAVQLSHGGRYTDLCYGYNAFWARVLPNLRLDGDGFEIETIMNVRALKTGMKVVEVPSYEGRRIHGESHLRTIPDGWRVLKVIGREARGAARLGPASKASFRTESPRLVADPAINSAPYQLRPFEQNESSAFGTDR